ncbi:MAG TPA: prepilin-type N-terminal cleavage/methylation domain-containing protein [Candidatus Ozemobacteraceae bacterium]
MSRGGFTLIELIVVVAVIAILSVTAYSYYQDSIESARFNVVRQNRALTQDALGRYFQSNLSYPTDLHALTPTYLSQSVEELLIVPLGSASIEVQIPDTYNPSTNPMQHTGGFAWVPITSTQKGQIRAVRVKYGAGSYIE